MSQPNQLASNPALEAAIRANRGDPAAYSVYADFLQSQGSSLGELIALELAQEAGADPAKRERAHAIMASFDLPGLDLATVQWRRGMWEWLRLENSRNWMDDKFDARELARRMFTQPPCRVLAELRIGVLRWESNYIDVPAVLDEAAAHAWASGVTRLHLGDIGGSDIDMAHHVIGDVGARITKTFPALRSLVLHSGEQSWATDDETFGIAGLALPELVELTIETCSLSKARAEAVITAALPKLEKLELWFGSADQGADASVEQLVPLLGGDVFPLVRHLGLKNAECEDAIAVTVADSPIAARLLTLDLSMGTLSDDAAVELADKAIQLPLLQRLDVSENFLTERGLTALRGKFREVVSNGQKDIDGDYRYVTVGE